MRRLETTEEFKENLSKVDPEWVSLMIQAKKDGSEQTRFVLSYLAAKGINKLFPPLAGSYITASDFSFYI
ncbi:hypothetical protein [Bacillus sp. FJAT-44742]|uniref:hypothetical protein n=1 Tax=Bacillus sp. FJAT-44742 TaxID=2014005 RepID=UPI0018E1E655|nr:hypothetical protein [Bacillus sp. FJAT-44742]